MKKIFAALLLCAFAVSAYANYLVYDYKASIKRIDADYKVRKVAVDPAAPKGAKQNIVTESYGIASDTLYGYVVLPACEACDDQNGIASSLTDNEGFAYLAVKGNKYAKKAGLKFLVKTPVEAESAIFGAYVATGLAQVYGDTPLASIADAKKAWMMLFFAGVEDTNQDQEMATSYILKKYGNEVEKAKLGFFGLDQNSFNDICNYGFGSVKNLTTKEAITLGFCSNDVIPGTFCRYIDSISGVMQTAATYAGMCNVTPMWDVCYSEAQSDTVDYAPIFGTWSIKYNAKLSLAATDLTAAENAILAKFNTTADKVIEGDGFPQR